jgi:hypothetical protein
MLGLGELIFVLVIVVQGVAAIAAATQKKKKRAAARAKEIEALEGPGASATRSRESARLTERSSEPSRADQLLQQKRAQKEKKRQERQEQLQQLRTRMETSAGVTMKDAMSMMGITVVTQEDAKTAASAASTRKAVRRPTPPAVSPRPPLAVSQPVGDEVPDSSFQSTGRKAKRSPFESAKAGQGVSSSSGRRSSQAGGLSLMKTLRSRRALRQAFVLKTLLEPPVALREDPETVG